MWTTAVWEPQECDSVQERHQVFLYFLCNLKVLYTREVINKVASLSHNQVTWPLECMHPYRVSSDPGRWWQSWKHGQPIAGSGRHISQSSSSPAAAFSTVTYFWMWWWAAWGSQDNGPGWWGHQNDAPAFHKLKGKNCTISTLNTEIRSPFGVVNGRHFTAQVISHDQLSLINGAELLQAQHLKSVCWEWMSILGFHTILRKRKIIDRFGRFKDFIWSMCGCITSLKVISILKLETDSVQQHEDSAQGEMEPPTDVIYCWQRDWVRSICSICSNCINWPRGKLSWQRSSSPSITAD